MGASGFFVGHAARGPYVINSSAKKGRGLLKTYAIEIFEEIGTPYAGSEGETLAVRRQVYKRIKELDEAQFQGIVKEIEGIV